MDKTLLDLELTDGSSAAAYEVFDRWVRAYRKANPYNERTDLELIDTFAQGEESSHANT